MNFKKQETFFITYQNPSKLKKVGAWLQNDQMLSQIMKLGISSQHFLT